MLPDDDEVVPPDPAGQTDERPRVVRSPDDEFQEMLAALKRDVDAVLGNIFQGRLSKNAALGLTLALGRSCEITAEYERAASEEGRRGILAHLADTISAAAFTASFVAEDERDIEMLVKMRRELRDLQHELVAVLRSYRSAGN